ncbi:homeobox protein MSX-1 [Condylostylus longicornis]|uniref:homeobox protein MSX-1 n=1 Tax=Condylostylus longicornis TaxID=2530218 RepID=UPI00244DC737|nr:homeobox protein MSX-1 [Condylostylus longicornis]
MNNHSDSSNHSHHNNEIKISDFSIDHILNRAGENFCGTNNSNINTCTNLMLRTAPIFDWLQYTRYRPPKLPRPFRPGPIKRTPGRLPRVPFTPAQLNTLENAYKQSTYLSSEDANKLALQLDLTNTRVKIWFQNRRARERREKRERGESPDILTPISSPELNLNAESP